jgi:mono/diheme cytochrome c family protein
MTKLLVVLITSILTAGLTAAADAKAGKVSYDKACKSCHGMTGQPNAAIAKATKAEMRHLGSKEVQALSDAEMKKIITDGHGKMKPVKTVSGAAVDDVVAYMRTFKQ